MLTVTPGKANRLYTIDNGGNQGWGGYPANEGSKGTVTNNYVAGEPGSAGTGVNDPTINNFDALHYIGNTTPYQTGSYYKGHPILYVRIRQVPVYIHMMAQQVYGEQQKQVPILHPPTGRPCRLIWLIH